jgi:flagellar protein FliS
MSSLSAPLAASPSRPGAASAGAYGASRYRDAELASATPGQLVVMLFDRLLLTLRRARMAADAGKIELRCESLLAAGDMIMQLRLSLDHAQGGAIAASLDQLYGFALRELAEANRLQDASRIDGVLKIAGELRDAFAQVVARGAGGAPQARSA